VYCTIYNAHTNDSSILDKFLDTSPEEIAKHFCALDWQDFLRVKTWEFLTMTNLNEQRAPHALRYKNLSNFRSDWFTTVVVLEKDLESRKKMISLFIEVAMQCLDYFNHFSAFAILTALTDEAVDRLRDTWKSLPATTLKRFEELKKGASNAKTNLERFVACIPAVGMFLHRKLTSDLFRHIKYIWWQLQFEY